MTANFSRERFDPDRNNNCAQCDVTLVTINLGRDKRDKHVAHISLYPNHYLMKGKWGNYRGQEINGREYYVANYKKISDVSEGGLLDKINREIEFLKGNLIHMDDVGNMHEVQSEFHVFIFNQAGETVHIVR
ncbi:MAG: hypothetical protein ONB11_12085 [candidate division KSB1 bacterium]|nr:hypothetical protein [candidate division KSB1 bacterium]